jgi:hypothetical protein
MPVFETVGGGTPHHHHHHHHHHDGAQHGGLNSFERAAAQQALAKLTGSSGFTPSAQPTPAGGSFHFSPIKTLSQGLVAGKGTDTYAGGVASARFAISKISSDTVLSGSTAPRLDRLENPSVFRLSADTINLAGATAAGVKAADPSHSQQSSHTITLSDKTTLTITGVHGSEIIKPHGH